MPYGYKQPGNWASLRKAVFQRDGRICWVCKQEGADQVDAIVSESQGGSHADLENLAPIHKEPCHRIKSENERRAGWDARRTRTSSKRNAELHPGKLN